MATKKSGESPRAKGLNRVKTDLKKAQNALDYLEVFGQPNSKKGRDIVKQAKKTVKGHTQILAREKAMKNKKK